ncbi:DUF2079 domain-containing protein [Candidatus Bathyarchaeota archaeon]|nr:DUF2079 domain-containing protein [Candidatus Bathyarchaeota archaeon]
MDSIENTIINRVQTLVAAAIITYTILLSFYTFQKHISFTTYAWDLGIFDQAFWTTVNEGKLFYYTCEMHMVKSGSFFGVHFSPILFLLLPIYYLFQSPVTLLVLQSAILGLSAYPVYLIARDRFSGWMALFLVTLYLLNPSLHGVNAYDFHVQCFLPLIFNFMLLFTQRGNWKALAASTFLALTVQEQVVYFVLAYILLLAGQHILERRSKSQGRSGARRGVYVLLLGLAMAWGIFSAGIIHYLNPVVPDHLKAGQNFAVLGVKQPSEIPYTVVTEPSNVFRALSFDWFDKIVYVLILTTPYLFICYMSPVTLIPALLWLTLSFLSNYPPYYRIGFQYPSYVIPFIFYSFILGLERLKDSMKAEDNATFKNVLKLLLALNVAACVAFSPLSPFTDGFYLSPAYIKPYSATRNTKLHEMLALIEPDASVLTQDNIFPHVSGRAQAYVIIPEIAEDPETWRKADELTMSLRTDYILIDLKTDPHNTAKTAFALVERHGYNLLAFYDNIYMYSLLGAATPVIYEPMDVTYTHLDLITLNAEVVEDASSTCSQVIAYRDINAKSRTIWYGPYSIMPEGDYQAVFTLKTQSHGDTGVILLDARTNGETLCEAVVDAAALPAENTWTSVALNFTLTRISTDLELRGILLTDSTDVRLDCIRVTQSP